MGLSELNDMCERRLGFDKTNEIINLWFEFTFFKIAVEEILDKNPKLIECLTEEFLNNGREKAKDYIRNKFPQMNVTFKDSEEKSESS